MVDVEVVETPELGDRSYVVHDGSVAIVVDPQRDTDRITAVTERCAVRVALVLETHIHNDYVTGGYQLAADTGARYAVNAEDEVTFDRTPVRDGDTLTAGALTVHVVATPGHTDTHLAFAISDARHPDEPAALFTGGSLLYGSVGRTDLVDPARTAELTHAQYRSAHRLAGALPDATAVFPTHGFGSFCSSGSAAGGTSSTIGLEKTRNDALTATDEDAFVRRLIANLTAYPSYYAHMAPLNRGGPVAPDLSMPEQVDPSELARRIGRGDWVIDLRERVAYAADHLAGTVSIALGTQFATYVGWVSPWQTPLTIIGATREEVADAQRQLMRIGIDRLAGAATGRIGELAPAGERRGYPCVDFAGLAAQDPMPPVLDVRRDDEWLQGHIAGSVHVPLSELLDRLDELPGGPIWVHCASGFRASIAASLLDRAGREVVYVDDDYDNVAGAGLPITTPAG